MVEIKPMDESYILWGCLHCGPMDPATPIPRGESWWAAAPDLPAHPWSDETIVELAKKHNGLNHGGEGDACVEFMREMIQRYGTCAMLAWEHGKVAGFLRVYPLEITRLLFEADPEKQRRSRHVMNFEPDPSALWVQCVMTSRPYSGPEPAYNKKGRRVPGMKEAGARRGIGLKLAQGLVSWAKGREWKRIVADAHADIDCMYGITGKGGLTFWRKAGFEVIGTHYDEPPNEPWLDEWRNGVESQAKAKGISKREAWTWHRMAYEL